MDGYTRLRDKVFGKFKLEYVQPLTLEMWEDRILPLLADMEAEAGGFPSKEFVVEGCRVVLRGNSLGAEDFFASANSGSIGFAPEAQVYVFSRMKDLSILRRFKEYPDETGREQLEEPWAGECAEARAIVLLNCKWK